jgi:hypothetical protein
MHELQLQAQGGLGARQQLGRRKVATAEPPPVGVVGQPEVQKLVAERKHGGAGGESGRDDEFVVPELDAPRYCGGDSRGDLENEPVDAKTVCHAIRQVVAKVAPKAAARVRDAHTTGQGMTYSSDISVALLLSASESAVAPASPI